jgi:hypothetical protein
MQKENLLLTALREDNGYNRWNFLIISNAERLHLGKIELLKLLSNVSATLHKTALLFGIGTCVACPCKIDDVGTAVTGTKLTMLLVVAKCSCCCSDRTNSTTVIEEFFLFRRLSFLLLRTLQFTSLKCSRSGYILKFIAIVFKTGSCPSISE